MSSIITWKKRLLFWLSCEVLCVIILLLVLSTYSFRKMDPNLNFNQQQNKQVRLDGYKSILIWNNPERGESGSDFGYGHKSFLKQKCEFHKCAFYDRSSSFLPVEEYDAVIVNMARIWRSQSPNFRRKKHQRFVFLTQESPQELPFYAPSMEGVSFNWTMSYRLNADVRLLYGRIEPRSTAPKTSKELEKLVEQTHLPSAKNYAANKTNMVVWMASHCHTSSSRETYVSELRKYIPVDVYGKCGSLSCFRHKKHWRSDPSCYDMIESKYKFYLSFENSVCTDYVTEKFFEIISRGIVPVVYGGANYSLIAPYHSYINALEYTPEKLANYLKELDANDTLYNEYFWWKEHYRLEIGLEQMVRHGFCDLCKKLHQDENITKYYPELISEWHPNMQCRYFSSWDTEQCLIPRFFSWLFSRVIDIF